MKDTIDMAREAGYMRTVHGGAEVSMASLDCLKAFESLVRADEREACAKVCEEVLEQYRGTAMGKHAELVGDNCAAAIRARGNT
jgi:hypothetical protein